MTTNTPELVPVSAPQEIAKQGVGFTLLYHAADVEWVGGTIAGNVVEDRYGINPWAVGAVVAGAVATAEYQLSKVGAKLFDSPDTEPEEAVASRSVRAGKELAAAAYAAFAGSANGVRINDSLGLESTPRRRKVQAALFGTAVGLWSTPTPGFEQGSEVVKSFVEDATSDPKSFVIYSAVSIGSILTASEVTKRVRKRFSSWRKNLQEN
jgi:hypothetical protein